MSDMGFRSIAITIILSESILMAHYFNHLKRSIFKTIVCWGMTILGTFIVSQLIFHTSWPQTTWIYGGFMVIACYYLFDVPLCGNLFTFFMIATLIYIPELICEYSFSYLSNFFVLYNKDLLFLGMFCFCNAIIMLFACKFARTKIQNCLTKLRGTISGIAIIPATAYGLMRILFPLSTQKNITANHMLTMVGFFIFLFCTYQLLLHFINLISDYNTAKAQTRLLSSRLAQSESCYITLMDNIRDATKIQQDFEQHLQIINMMCSRKEYDKLQHYLIRLEKKLAREEKPMYCRNNMLNTLIDYYAGLAQENGICFECDADFPDSTQKISIHACIVLGNALQNALEACEKIEPKKRSIRVKVKFTNGTLTIEVRNSFDGEIRMSSGMITSTKRPGNYGMGLKNIKNTVEQYNGYFNTLYTTDVFVLKAVITIGQEAAV